MTATVWQRTPEWEPDPQQPREHLLSIAIDTARNGEPILIVNDEQAEALLTGACTRSNGDVNAAIDAIASAIAYAVRKDLDARAQPKSRLINRGVSRY